MKHIGAVLGDFGSAPSSLLNHALDEEAIHHCEAVSPLFSLHSHPDGYVCFAVADEDIFVPRFAIPIQELASMLPAFVAHLMKDGFVSINASWRPRRCNPKEDPSIGRPLHRRENLRYLCACYADLDCYKCGVDTATAVGTVLSLQDQGILPPASMIVRSGRGIWLFWYLRDAVNPEHAQRAFPEQVELYCRIQRSLGERLHSLGVDVGARDPSRYVRHPGSLNTKSGEVVSWLLQGGPSGVPLYTLPGLAHLLQLEERSERHDPTFRRALTKDPTPSPQRKGWEALGARRLREFRILQDLRGGFKEGCRNRAALLYVWLLRCNGARQAEVTEQLRKFAAECSPPLGEGEQAGALTGLSRPRSRFLDRTISEWLDITPEESTWLLKLKPAPRFRSQQSHAPVVDRITADVRRQRILEHCVACKRTPSTREMATHLTSQGIPISHAQIAKDYQILGMSTTSRNESHHPLQLTLAAP